MANLPKRGDILYGTMPQGDGSFSPVGFRVRTDQIRMLRSGGGVKDTPHVYGHWETQDQNKEGGWYPLDSLMSLEQAQGLKKADELPKDALHRPSERAEHTEEKSPWDVVSSAPVPTQDQLGLPTWLGKPVVHKDHLAELEQAAAIHEFGHKMPRQQAEMKAYNDYVRKQRVLASAHHLAGMKAANAAGDEEAARKHGLLYKLHSEALGHSAAGPAHPDVVAASASPQKVYRFKRHAGDAFAFAGERGGPHEFGKQDLAKALHDLYDGAQELLKSFNGTAFGIPASMIFPTPSRRHEPIKTYVPPKKEPTDAEKKSAKAKENFRDDPTARLKKDELEKSSKPRGGERGGTKNREREIYETHEAEHGRDECETCGGVPGKTCRHDAAQASPEPEPPDLDKKEKSPEDKKMKAKDRSARASKTTCPREGCGKYKPHWANVCVDCHRQGYALGKSDIEIRDLSNGACRCEHYNFPHRRGGGKCKSR